MLNNHLIYLITLFISMDYKETKKNLRLTLQKKLSLKNLHEVPMIEKVIVAIWVGSLHTRKGIKDFSEFEKNLSLITAQKPTMVMSKKNISNFKLRSGMPSMLKVTLRWEKAYHFLFKLMSIVLPRVRDFSGLSNKSFDNKGNYSIWLQSYALFPELHPDTISLATGLQITLHTSWSDKVHNKSLIEEMWFVFQS